VRKGETLSKKEIKTKKRKRNPDEHPENLGQQKKYPPKGVTFLRKIAKSTTELQRETAGETDHRF